MAANNESGAINNIAEIGKLLHSKSIPMHTDCVQVFGKTFFCPRKLNLDSFTVSFHKLHGPPGVGLLAIKNKFLDFYGLCPLIFGSQNLGMRGGTENLPGIAASFSAMVYTLEDRESKNIKLRFFIDRLIASLRERFVCCSQEDYVAAFLGETSPLRERIEKAIDMGECVVVFLGPSNRSFVLSQLLLISVLRHVDGYRRFCNIAAGRLLEIRHKVIIGLAAACNSGSVGGVLEAMGVPTVLWNGTLRISLEDDFSDEKLGILIEALVDVFMDDDSLIDF